MKRLWMTIAISVSLGCRDGVPSSATPNAFTDGAVAVVANVNDSAWPRDALTIDSVAVIADTLRLAVRYGGGCRPHRVALLLGNAFMESYPVQVHARLAHDAAGDMCKALVARTVDFDLTTLKRRYRASYGAGAAVVVLNLAGYSGSVRYAFD
jgi:hypothetical protein